MNVNANSLFKTLKPMRVLYSFVGCTYTAHLKRNRKKTDKAEKLFNATTKISAIVVVLVSLWVLPQCTCRRHTITAGTKFITGNMNVMVTAANLLFAFANGKKLTNTLAKFVTVDSQLQKISHLINYRRSRKRVILGLVLCVLLQILKLIMDSIAVTAGILKPFCMSIFMLRFSTTLIIECYLILLLIELRVRFKALNNHISGVIDGNYRKTMAPINRFKLIVAHSTSDSFIKSSKLHSELCDIGKLINRSFEGQILVINFASFMHVVSSCFYLVEVIDKNHYFKDLTNYFYILYWILMHVTETFAIFYAFTSAAAEAKKTSNILYNRKSINTKINYSNLMVIFTKQLYFHNAKFSVYQLYPLDWTALFFVSIRGGNGFPNQGAMDVTRNVVHAGELAIHSVEKCLNKDNTAPTLPELMNITPQTGPTASGLTDHDYPSLSNVSHGANNMVQIKTLSKVPLPPEIMEHFSHMQCHCMMGLFTEVNRAWLTIDSDIYLWTYEAASDVAYFDGLNETIISVGLVRPKAGVFHSFIKFLLVLNTAVDIIVLGVTFSSNDIESMAEIQLVPDPVFTIPTDGSTITAVAGTLSGRLFLGSKDGSLYEIVYQAESSWFGKRFKKINHSTSTLSFLVPSFLNAALNEEDGITQISVDNSRHILYTLSEKGCIEVYCLGESGNSLSRITRLSQSNLVHQAMSTVKTLDSQNFRPIVSISAVELSESLQVNLVAVTQTGIRFYLSTSSLSNMQQMQRPYTLALQHVRLPPGYSANMITRPRMVHMAHYSDRNLILLSSVSDKDLLWCLSADLFPFSSTLMEAYTTVALDGPALAMAEVKHSTLLKQKLLPSPPSIITQHMEPPKKYVILTAQGAHVFLKMRPVDLLRQLLLDSRGQDTEAVKTFFTLQQADQACATSLILACLDDAQNAEIAEYATRAFFLYGGEPKLAPTMLSQSGILSGSTMFAPNIISTPLGPHQQYQYQQSPSPTANLSFSQYPQQYQSNLNSPNISQTQNFDPSFPFQFSSKHNGLYFYLARTLRPLWNMCCVEKTVAQGKKIFLVSSISSTECILILSHLNALKSFFQRNTQLSMGSNSVITNTALNETNKATYTIQDVQLEERHSLDAFKVFVNQCCQVVGLWKILCEHQFHILVDVLQDSQKQVLQNTSFKDLFIYGRDMCYILITNLINSYLGDNASVDSISLKLRDVCPDLYKNEDAAFSKANEMLKTARSIQNLDEKEELLIAALQLCKSVAPSFNLHEICQQFTLLKAYHAVIELCVLCASKVDPGSLGQNFYKRADQNDQDGYQFYTKRMDIYREILFLLENLYIPQQDALSYTMYSDESLTNSNPQIESSQLIRRVINEILQQSDELLHVAVYEWMISKNMSGDIIQIKQVSLETYLVKMSQENPNNITVLELLWKYYESNNNHASAAKVLNNLASKTGNSLTLRDRLGYLARSIMCMRSDKVGYAPYLGVFLRELEDKIDIAKVQEQILDAINNLSKSHPNAEEAINALNSGLYEITQLYEDFAEPFGLWECKLAIIDCAGYLDTNLVENIWRNILNCEVRRSMGSGSDKMMQILSKVKSLARLYKLSANCFPLAFIIQDLEVISAKLKADVGLVPNFFVTIEISIELLINTYNNLMCISSADRFWNTEENEFRFSEAITVLINVFVCTHEAYTNVEKRKLIALCQDTVAGMLSNLYSKPNTENLINALRGIQIQLSRL